jgi:hypothetical protein
MKIRRWTAVALLLLVSAFGGWEGIVQAKQQKLCFMCSQDGGCVPGPDCCITIKCPDGAWYSCLGGGKTR